jgi:hypothetical protein
MRFRAKVTSRGACDDTGSADANTCSRRLVRPICRRPRKLRFLHL